MDNNSVGTSPDSQQNAVNNAAPAEKVFTQDEVNKIVGARAMEAAEKARKEALNEFNARNESSKPKSNENAPSFDKESLKREAIEEFEQMQRRKAEKEAEERTLENAERFTKEYFGKLSSEDVKSRYADADEVLGGFNHGAYTHLIMLANKEPNTADLMYHFANNPLKAAQFEQAARHDPHGALKELKRLSNDLGQNIKAKDSVKKASPPLSRMSPSNIGADNGLNTLDDFKRSKLCRW